MTHIRGYRARMVLILGVALAVALGTLALHMTGLFLIIAATVLVPFMVRPVEPAWTTSFNGLERLIIR